MKAGKKIVSFFHRPVSNSTDFKNLTWEQLFEKLTGPPIKLSKPTQREKAAKGDYYIRGIIKAGNSRSDKYLKKSNLIIIDIDKPIEGYKKPSPEEIASVAADIHERYKIPFAVHSSATPGNSRAIFLSRPFKKEDTRAITRFIYEQFRKRGCKFKFAGESSTYSQPWFIPQSSKPANHFADGIVRGKPFNWKKFVKLDKTPKTSGINLASRRGKISDISALDQFITDLKLGTIHRAAIKYMGWLTRTTDYTYKQIENDTTTLIKEHYVQQKGEPDKLKRWMEGTESGKLKRWFERQGFERANLYRNENDEGYLIAGEHKEKKVSWLWEGILHKSKFNLLAGDSGSNKTTFALRIASHVTKGQGFLGGEDFKPGGVLMLTSEDDLEDTILPRLNAVGANPNKFFYTSDDFDFNTNGIVKLQKYIDKIYEQTQIPIKLIIVDPVDSFTGNSNTNIGSVVKSICNQFNLFARKNNLCFLGIMHFKKVAIDGKNTLKNAIAGSYAWVSTPRSVLCMFSDPVDSLRKYLGMVKNNNASINYHYELSLDIENESIAVSIAKKVENINIESKVNALLRSSRSGKIKKHAQRLYNYMVLNKMEMMPVQEAREILMGWTGGIKKQVMDACKCFDHKNVKGIRYYIRDSYIDKTEPEGEEF